MITIDAHQHFWELGRFEYEWLRAPALHPIRRDFLPADLQPLLRESGVQKSVFVQTQHNMAETRWVLDLAETYEFIAGVVGWVDLAAVDCEDQLLQLQSHPKFVGVRHVTHDEPDDDFIVRPDLLRGLKVLEKHAVPFDLLFFVRHLPHAAQLAQQLPGLPLVIDHLSKPEIRRQTTEGWEAPFREAARYPNVYVKLSGMITEADWNNWQSTDLETYVNIALEAFGPERCMFGSDWPVCQLAGSYRQVHDALAHCLESLSAEHRAAVWGGTAQRFYQLPV